MADVLTHINNNLYRGYPKTGSQKPNPAAIAPSHTLDRMGYKNTLRPELIFLTTPGYVPTKLGDPDFII